MVARSAAAIREKEKLKVKVWCGLKLRPDKADRVGVVERGVSAVVTV